MALSVHIGKHAAQQQGVFGKIDAGHDVGRAKGRLLGFGKEVVGIAVQHHAPHDLHRHQGFGDEFGGVQDVEVELVGVFFGHDLQTQFKRGVIPGLNALP